MEEDNDLYDDVETQEIQIIEDTDNYQDEGVVSPTNDLVIPIKKHLQDKIEQLKEEARRQQLRDRSFINKMKDYHSIDQEYLRLKPPQILAKKQRQLPLKIEEPPASNSLRNSQIQSVKNLKESFFSPANQIHQNAIKQRYNNQRNNNLHQSSLFSLPSISSNQTSSQQKQQLQQITDDEQKIQNLYQTSNKSILDSYSIVQSQEYLLKKNFIAQKVWMKDVRNQQQLLNQQESQKYSISIDNQLSNLNNISAHSILLIDPSKLENQQQTIDHEYASKILKAGQDWNDLKYNMHIKQKKDKKILTIVDNLKLNQTTKRKVAYTMRNSVNENNLLQMSNQNTGTSYFGEQKHNNHKLPKIKSRDLAKQIQDMKLKKIEKFTKAYVQDYTIFNYKIDSVLNEAYGFVKTHNR
eukprot:403343104